MVTAAGIVEKKKGKVKASLIKVLRFLVAMVIGAAAGLGIAVLMQKGDIIITGYSFWAMIGFFVLALYFQVVVHEFGHFLFGKLAGFTFYSFRVSYVAIQRENRKLKLKLFRNLGYLGLCIMIPADQNVPRKSFMLYFAGGLLLNLLSFLVCLLLVRQDIAGNPFILATGFFGLFFFIMNALPLTTKSNFRTDGSHLYNCLKQNEAYQNYKQVFAINAQLMSGTRPACLPETYLNMHIRTADPVARISFLTYDYYRFLDRQEFLRAFEYQQEIEQNLEHYPKGLLKELQAELLFGYCFLQPEPEKASQLYEQIKDRLATDHTVSGYRVKAAYELFITADLVKARHYLEQGRQVLNAYIIPGLIPMEEDLSGTLTATLETKSQPEPVGADVIS